MFRSKLPRLYELKDLISDPSSPSAYFQGFEKGLLEHPQRMEIYAYWEQAIQDLDQQAWTDLKGEALPHLMVRHRDRGHQLLFDILNQAHAYRYLKSIDCQNVAFIPRGARRTPDLEGCHDGVRILCEVKTINISDEEIRWRNRHNEVREGLLDLAPGFFRKLSADIEQARQQLLEYNPTRSARHIVYVSPHFDDFVGDCKDRYFQQIDDYLTDQAVADVQIVIHNARTPLHVRVSMRAATVHNDD